MAPSSSFGHNLWGPSTASIRKGQSSHGIAWSTSEVADRAARELQLPALSCRFSALSRGNQRVRPDPLALEVIRWKHRDHVERFMPDVHERVRNTGWNSCHVRCIHGECLVTYAVSSGAFEQHMGLFGGVNMKPGAAADVRLGDDERKTLEAVLITDEAVYEFAGDAIIIF